MQLNHIGINVANAGEIHRFYQDILGFLPQRSFPIPREIAQMFFGIDEATEAFILLKGTLMLELFVHDKPLESGFAHLCVEIENREDTARKCAAGDYPVIRMKRENGDLLFVKDKAGNVFELKEKPHENLS
ncbi:hypothetical protein MNBD_BACTEROID07-354 [hydrothermal vent metagenome]|uniref:VOC domain-containing protein n=1 Tax=hydrothermal vent metagenome TaxID=652676 RepID=A0A3B0UKP1_9ZZZZ